ncbi:uncharacterized protein N7515_009072 [Penicillium bovifimosum]|uniref:ABC transmembrane type-1 domain-containing protein n=1 Tax=Penicillium bovifimosum TaxID=126998 RepID=A0A9W9GIY1_9EURO|nr:uncharacterized protein N7515_009072 [Penicillium bovifimosum]KAJ5121111.1 hypothetical protein N7515_009072 [Penicillium bovifimosum]
MSPRINKDGGKKSGFGEIWRLLRIARPESKALSFAFFFLVVSSSMTMAVPLSIVRPKVAANCSASACPCFTRLSRGILLLGAGANYGRIIIIRIVGEQIVARLRSKPFRRTFVQDAEFCDANRVGALISRVSSDTIIVGKSITQNLSDGLRAGVSGAAGFNLLAYTCKPRPGRPNLCL